MNYAVLQVDVVALHILSAVQVVPGDHDGFRGVNVSSEDVESVRGNVVLALAGVNVTGGVAISAGVAGQAGG